MGRFWVMFVGLMFFALELSAAEVGVADDVAVTFYGYVKVDLAYDQALSSHGNYIMYVKPHALNNRTSTLSLTARQTRLGVWLEKGKNNARFEVDFYGGGTENKNQLVLRQAYVDVPLSGVTLRAGQAPDIISPLSPFTLNYTVGWGAGNIGYRRPVVQVLKPSGHVFLAVGIARSIGNDLNGDSVIDGEDANMPTVQGRLGVRGSQMAFGVSGHYGLMDSPGAAESGYCTWSVNVDAHLSLSHAVSVLGEAYTGVNVGTYFGAILNGDCAHDLQSRGGWLAVQIKPRSGVALSFGGGADDLVDEQKNYIATLPDARSRNAFVFGNVTYDVLRSVKTGLEISWWQTVYRNPSLGTDPNPTDVRLQWSIQSDF